MKRNTMVWLTVSVLSIFIVSLAPAQSLGDYARAHRKETSKHQAAKQFDNDNLPRTDKLSVVGQPAASPNPETAEAGKDSQTSDSSANAPQGANPDQAGKTAEDKDSRKKEQDNWSAKIAEQKKRVDLLSRELDVAQREYRLRAAAFYADAGNRLRGSANWDQEDAQYKKQIADKQEALDKAKQQLDELQEQARKAGVPASARE